jgi:hypothetical protein
MTDESDELPEYGITQGELLELLIVKNYLKLYHERNTEHSEYYNVDPEWIYKKIKIVVDGIANRCGVTL